MSLHSSKNRFAKLSAMTMRIAGKTLNHKIQNILKNDEEKQKNKQLYYQQVGEQIVQTLGQMKGAAMKVGQIASQYNALLPKEIAQQIIKLQQQATPVDFKIIQQQVEQQLSCKISEVFHYFETQPLAVASIAQVHRAELKNGQKVVVKVQYPNMEQICRSDLTQLRWVFKFLGILNISKELQDALFTEIEDSLLNELNYELEAHYFKMFARFHQAVDNKVIIPQVIDQYSTRQILVLTEEQGERIEIASTWSQEVRNELGRRLIGAIAQQIFVLHKFHCDPHAGNFAFREDGSVVMYDFGAIKQLSTQAVKQLQSLLQATQDRDFIQLEQAMTELQILSADAKGQFDTALYQQWIDVLLRPLTTQYDFAQNSAHKDARQLIQPSLKYWKIFKPATSTLLLSRTVSGHYWNLVHLKVNDHLEEIWQNILSLQIQAERQNDT